MIAIPEDHLERISILNELQQSFLEAWSIYTTVVLGALAFLATRPDVAARTGFLSMVVVFFSLFAFSNYMALESLQQQRHGLTEGYELKDEIIWAARPPGRWTLILAHVAFDLLTVALMFGLGRSEAVRKRVRRRALQSGRMTSHNSRARDVPSIQVSWDQARELWKLTNDYRVEIPRSALGATGTDIADPVSFCVPAGFEFDLASIPRFLWILVAPFELSLAAPLLHDYLYENESLIVPGLGRAPERREADRAFLHLMNQEKVSSWRRIPAYLAVRSFGWIWWRKDRPIVCRGVTDSVTPGSSA